MLIEKTGNSRFYVHASPADSVFNLVDIRLGYCVVSDLSGLLTVRRHVSRFYSCLHCGQAQQATELVSGLIVF